MKKGDHPHNFHFLSDCLCVFVYLAQFKNCARSVWSWKGLYNISPHSNNSIKWKFSGRTVQVKGQKKCRQSTYKNHQQYILGHKQPFPSSVSTSCILCLEHKLVMKKGTHFLLFKLKALQRRTTWMAEEVHIWRHNRLFLAQLLCATKHECTSISEWIYTLNTVWPHRSLIFNFRIPQDSLGGIHDAIYANHQDNMTEQVRANEMIIWMNHTWREHFIDLWEASWSPLIEIHKHPLRLAAREEMIAARRADDSMGSHGQASFNACHLERNEKVFVWTGIISYIGTFLEVHHISSGLFSIF